MKKISMIMAVSLLLPTTAAAFAAGDVSTLSAAPIKQEVKQGDMQQVSIDKQALQEVAATANKMDEYITMGQDGLLHIDAKAESVVGKSAYSYYAQGVASINTSLQLQELKVENGKLALNNQTIHSAQNERFGGQDHTDLTYSNPYWWGVAITFDEPDTKNFVHYLNNCAYGWAATAGIAGLIPGAQAASAASVILSLGCAVVANNMAYNDQGQGVTLNVHWIPTGYISSNANY